MTNEEILLAKKKYENLLLEKQELEDKKQRIKDLESNPVVREYLDLTKKVNSSSNSFDELTIALKSFEDISKNTIASNKIMVYMGTYYEKGDSDTYNRKVTVYKDLESCKEYKIHSKKQDVFEKKYEVIDLFEVFPIMQYCKNQRTMYELGFDELRRHFFRNLLQLPQEEVVKQLIKVGKIDRKK